MFSSLHHLIIILGFDVTSQTCSGQFLKLLYLFFFFPLLTEQSSVENSKNKKQKLTITFCRVALKRDLPWQTGCCQGDALTARCSQFSIVYKGVPDTWSSLVWLGAPSLLLVWQSRSSHLELQTKIGKKGQELFIKATHTWSIYVI